MKRLGICIAALAALSISAAVASAQTKSGIDKLYILNCGEGISGDISLWSPGVNVGQSMDFVDNCYLIHHPSGPRREHQNVPAINGAGAEGGIRLAHSLRPDASSRRITRQ
jgi:hypothetical protein